MQIDTLGNYILQKYSFQNDIAKWFWRDCHLAEMLFAEFHSAEWHFAESHCRMTLGRFSFIRILYRITKQNDTCENGIQHNGMMRNDKTKWLSRECHWTEWHQGKLHLQWYSAEKTLSRIPFCRNTLYIMTLSKMTNSRRMTFNRKTNCRMKLSKMDLAECHSAEWH